MMERVLNPRLGFTRFQNLGQGSGSLCALVSTFIERGSVWKSVFSEPLGSAEAWLVVLDVVSPRTALLLTLCLTKHLIR